MKFSLFLLLLISTNIDSAKGVVEISPSAVAPVCQVGDQLELTCTTTGMFLRWEITVMIPETMTSPFTVISSIGATGVPQQVTINNSTFTASRLSDPDTLPLMSRMMVSPGVSRSLNATVVNCFEGTASTDTVATTTIRIIDPDQFGLSIQSCSEDFSSNRVTVNLEWILLNSQIYYQQLLKNVSITTDPQVRNLMFNGNMRVKLVLSYNTLYNVSVTQHSTCQQLIRTVSFELSYNKCSDPMDLTNALAVGYVDPALDGQNISFICASGQVLNGSNSSMCMRNGEWEPDPGEVDCTGLSVTIGSSTTMLAKCSGPLYVLQISDSIRVIRESPGQEFDDTDTCCSSGFLITGVNTKTCLEDGEWELDTSQMNCNCEGVSAMLRTALVSVTCALVVMSVFIFIIGLFCGHYFSQKWRESADKSKQQQVTNPTNMELDLKLKENVAYITVHPIT